MYGAYLKRTVTSDEKRKVIDAEKDPEALMLDRRTRAGERYERQGRWPEGRAEQLPRGIKDFFSATPPSLWCQWRRLPPLFSPL